MQELTCLAGCHHSGIAQGLTQSQGGGRKLEDGHGKGNIPEHGALLPNPCPAPTPWEDAMPGDCRYEQHKKA